MKYGGDFVIIHAFRTKSFAVCIGAVQYAGFSVFLVEIPNTYGDFNGVAHLPVKVVFADKFLLNRYFIFVFGNFALVVACYHLFKADLIAC